MTHRHAHASRRACMRRVKITGLFRGYRIPKAVSTRASLERRRAARPSELHGSIQTKQKTSTHARKRAHTSRRELTSINNHHVVASRCGRHISGAGGMHRVRVPPMISPRAWPRQMCPLPTSALLYSGGGAPFHSSRVGSVGVYRPAAAAPAPPGDGDPSP